MSDVDTLIVTFQTQLSDVMETVIKTAMYEVSRLVEDGFMEEVKRRNREVESLRMQLQWLQSKLSDRVETGKSVDCTAKDDVELSRHTMVGERPEEQDDDISGGCPVKEEVEPVESWTRSHENEVTPESTQTSDNPFSTCGPESQATVEEEYGLPVVDVKEEEEVNSGGWSGTPAAAAGEAGPESHNTADDTETSPKQTLENSEELLQNVTKQDPQLSAAYVFAEEQEETNMATDASFQVDNISCWAGLTVATPGSLQNHRPETENDCDPRKIMRSLAQREEEPSSTLTADVTALFAPGSDQISPSRLQNSDALGVAIKQEVPVDYEQCVESHPEEKTMTKSATPFLSCSGKRHRLSSETLKQNRVTHKATVQDFMKLHSKAGTNLRLPAAIQHLHRPIKRPPHTLSNSTSAALSVVHSQVVNLNRIPSTSKATSAPPLSVQNRTGASWVGIKTQQQQSANSHQSHTNPAPHPQTHGHSGRHLLRCGQCGKCFPHPSNLKSHLQTHTGERPFICALCGRSFTKLSNLKAHRRVHTGERPYCCSACGKRFTQKCNLKRHQRIHLDVC